MFGDEGGDLVFARKPGVSRYLIIGTATMTDCAVGEELLGLRRELAWQGTQLEMFHACNDKQRIRDRVFDVISRAEVRIDATILDKAKAQDHLRMNPLRFYKEAWYLHFKYVAPRGLPTARRPLRRGVFSTDPEEAASREARCRRRRESSLAYGRFPRRFLLSRE